MSIALMTEAWRAYLPSGRKLVLLSLCDNANDQGECYPSIAAVARRCGMSERAVQGHIAALEQAGILGRQERGGRSTLYTINPRRICTPAESAPPQILHPSPAESAPPPAESAPTTPAESAPRNIIEPSLNRQLKHQGANRAVLSASILGLTDVDGDVLADFLTLRKAKKSPLTVTAVKGLRAEAAKAGMSLESVLALCCERGWSGFQAGWLDKAGPAVGAASAGIQIKKAGRHSGFEHLDYSKGVDQDGAIN